MGLPSDSELRAGLLRFLARTREPVRAREAYAALGESLSLTDEDLSLRLPSGHNRFQNRVRWIRQKLVAEGLIDASIRGRWSLTPAGREAATSLDAGH